MGKLLIVNGSPRAARSNSKQYAALLKKRWGYPVAEYDVTAQKHGEICAGIGQYTDILLAFPLYADSLPVTLMAFLKELAACAQKGKPKIHVLINCGFLEPEQNETAIEMIRLFCRRAGFPQGMVLSIGSGEAILTTPFAFLVKGRIKKLARGMQKGQSGRLRVTMPLSPKAFVRASTGYWTRYGARFGISREQMQTMDIEGR